MKRDTKIVAAVIAAIAAFVLSTSSACAFAVAHGASPKWRLAFRMLCHGIERRCLLMFGVPMPICARCTAIYVGMLAAIVAFAAVSQWRGVRSRGAELFARYFMYAAALPMAIDGVSQAFGLRESTNGLRLATGFIAAFAFVVWALTSVEKQDRTAPIPS
jgi:uncharacterized membrane protein